MTMALVSGQRRILGSKCTAVLLRYATQTTPGRRTICDVVWKRDSLPSLARLPELAPGESSLKIADLGCALGSNTVSTIDKALSHISALYRARSVVLLTQVQAFFNDLPENDFNSLFRSFPAYAGPGSTDIETDRAYNGHGHHRDNRTYFVAGVPGSFHGRLFPSRSIHTFTSFIALQFLPKIPYEVVDKRALSFNQGHIWQDRSSAAVRQAFSKEYVKGLTVFLKARAEELVSGGILLAIIAGTSGDLESESTKQPACSLTQVMDQCVHELVAEGTLRADLVDTFNMPLRFACFEEVHSAVEACGSFDAHVLKASEEVHIFPDDMKAKLQGDAKLCAKVYTAFIRTVYFAILEAHFGSEATELLLQRHALLVEQNHATVLNGLYFTFHLLVLSRK